MNASTLSNKSQLNNSVSKQLYSFAKSNRFGSTIQSPCKRRFYDYKMATMTDRSTGFGYGNKIDLANKTCVPAPGTYNNSTEFNNNRIKRRGYSFSRHSNRSIVNEEEVVKIPGPGKYQTDDDKNRFSNIKYTLRSKCGSIFGKGPTDLGPGQYNTIELINKDGKHSLAKYEDSRSRSFSRNSRFDEIRARTPGPGTYRDNEKLEMNKTGSYFVSKFKSNTSNMFGRSTRPPLGPKTLSPGPGGYQNFSEFGNKYQ